MSTGSKDGSRRAAGYDHEELYFHELNQELIKEQRKKNGTSNVLEFRRKPQNSTAVQTASRHKKAA